ncbi:MAG: SLBB domain-containing protein [Candidatus Pacebacteria bacterium]|nr:SLBB domain-containing protein [Candidatus Paceibacterota bacterium]
MDIISKLKESGLTGRSGSGFPTGLKWEAVKSTVAEKKYIVCNGSEGEPDVFKDSFILENYPEEVVKGIKLALETIDNSSAYIYLNSHYYQKYKTKLEELIRDSPIVLFKKTGGYLAGEETCVCEAIEGKRPEPRIKPPYPSEVGLWGCPTLINNVETFYRVAQIAEDNYKGERLYSIAGDVKKPGTYELLEDMTIRQILQETGNLPEADSEQNFFVQSGGISGEILLSNELDQQVKGIGGIVVYDREKTDLMSLMKKWTEFFMAGNCDKCTPCREGVYRMDEMLKKGEINKEEMDDFLFVLEQTSFCALGKGVAVPFRSLINKLLEPV